jgi:chromosome segregation ATPase
LQALNVEDSSALRVQLTTLNAQLAELQTNEAQWSKDRQSLQESLADERGRNTKLVQDKEEEQKKLAQSLKDNIELTEKVSKLQHDVSEISQIKLAHQQGLEQLKISQQQEQRLQEEVHRLQAKLAELEQKVRVSSEMTCVELLDRILLLHRSLQECRHH